MLYLTECTYFFNNVNKINYQMYLKILSSIKKLLNCFIELINVLLTLFLLSSQIRTLLDTLLKKTTSILEYLEIFTLALKIDNKI